MNDNQPNLEKLLAWIAELPDLSLESRMNFFSHLQKTQKIDSQAQDFIEKTIEFVRNKNINDAKILREKIAFLELANQNQKNTKSNLTYGIAEKASKWMMDKVENFKSWFKNKEAAEMQAAETSEKSREISEVDQIKASLNL